MADTLKQSSSSGHKRISLKDLLDFSGIRLIDEIMICDGDGSFKMTRGQLETELYSPYLTREVENIDETGEVPVYYLKFERRKK